MALKAQIAKRHIISYLLIAAGIVLLGATVSWFLILRFQSAIEESYQKIDIMHRSETAWMTVATLAYLETRSFNPTFSAEDLEKESGWGQLSFSATRSHTPRPSTDSTANAPQPVGEVVVARRLGDYVFSCHGSSSTASDPRLWVVMLSFDLRANSVAWPTGTVTVGRGDGTIRQFPQASFQTELATQNRLRIRQGLLPLPDPRTVLDVAIAKPKTD